MDTITHGIVGALIGKAFFADDPSPLAPTWRQAPSTAGRVAIISTTLGAIFPDIDVFAVAAQHSDLAVLTWHRNITHSLVLLPVWAVILASITWWLARRLEWPAPSWGTLLLIYAVGIASHIFLDLLTSFGTMVWSPLDYSRPAWDWIFIVDLAFTSLALLPQLSAWGFRGRKVATRRCSILFGVCAALAFVVVLSLQRVGVSISTVAAPITCAVCAIFFLLPQRHGTGTRVGRAKWCRIGLAVCAAYIGFAAAMHRSALQQVTQFAQDGRLEVLSLAALPLPPSLNHWAGLIATPQGIFRLDLDEFSHDRVPLQIFNNAVDNQYIEAARNLRDVQTFLWFARFPLFQYSVLDGHPTVRIADLRFFGDRPLPARSVTAEGIVTTATYEVVFTTDGKVISSKRLRLN